MSTALVTMYSTAMCPYCVQAERLLLAKGVQQIATRFQAASGCANGDDHDAVGVGRGSLRRRRR